MKRPYRLAVVSRAVATSTADGETWTSITAWPIGADPNGYASLDDALDAAEKIVAAGTQNEVYVLGAVAVATVLRNVTSKRI